MKIVENISGRGLSPQALPLYTGLALGLCPARAVQKKISGGFASSELDFAPEQNPGQALGPNI